MCGNAVAATCRALSITTPVGTKATGSSLWPSALGLRQAFSGVWAYLPV